MSLARLSYVVLFSSSIVWGSACSGDSAASDQPDGFFHATSRTMVEGKPEHAWRALPESYRTDVQSLVQDFASKMDEDVWNKGFEVARRVTEVLDKQRELILAQPMLAMMLPEDEEMDQRLDGVVGALGALLESKISTLEGLKSLDLDDFMADTMSDVFAPIREMAEAGGQDFSADWMEANFKTSVVSEQGDSATIKLEVEGKSAEEHKVVRVDGVWVPEELAGDWKSQIEIARQGLTDIQIDAATKMQIMTALGGAQAMLDQLLAAKTADEFGQAFGQAMEMVGERMGG